jgi:hypothetical protein
MIDELLVPFIQIHFILKSVHVKNTLVQEHVAYLVDRYMNLWDGEHVHNYSMYILQMVILML